MQPRAKRINSTDKPETLNENAETGDHKGQISFDAILTVFTYSLVFAVSKNLAWL